MQEIRVEDVFKRSGVPTHTYVQPVEFDKLLVALRTPGRGVVLEGPSGIGKTTAVLSALAELGKSDAAQRYTPRKKGDIDAIDIVLEAEDFGLVIIDDFHRLDDGRKLKLADKLKTLADEEVTSSKLVLVGINRAGDTLVSFGRDLNNRIDTIRFESNSDDLVEQLVAKGEAALHVAIAARADIVRGATGSFYLAQMLCHEACLAAHVTQRRAERADVNVSYEVIRSRVMDEISRAFMPIAVDFAGGTKLKREGRAPYLHLLKWLAESGELSIQVDRELAKHADLRQSVLQVIEKEFLRKLFDSDPRYGEVLHFDQRTRILGVEDPQFVFFLRTLSWNKFAERVGYVNVKFESKYDVALSFAGADREVARQLHAALIDHDLEVFYDNAEQHRILAENVEDYLAPIYASEATFVVALLGPEYPKKIWTKFESEHFRTRFGEGSVIPIWFSNALPGMFDESARVGGVTFDVGAPAGEQVEAIAGLLRKKIFDRRMAAVSE